MEHIDILKEVDIFQGMNEDGFQLIAGITKTRFVKKNTLIFNQGDNNSAMFIIISGRVDVSIFTDTGKELILSSLADGDYFGELSMLDGEEISANIIAVTNCQLLVIHRDDFYQILEQNPAISTNIVHHLCSKIRDLTKKVESFALLDVYHRLSLLLMDLSDLNETGQRVVNTILTHKNIALRIGSSREMVSRIMKDLEKGGYISVDHKVITIKKKLPSAW
jgi:CRP/FNR family cyclic AMP-dependent transcriptional regulator